VKNNERNPLFKYRRAHQINISFLNFFMYYGCLWVSDVTT